MIALWGSGFTHEETMKTIQQTARIGAAVLLIAGMGACSSTGGLGSVLGGGNQSGEVNGTVRGVNTRSQQISLQQSNGQNVTLTYDNRTQVVYQNRNYPVTSLEYGDQITARLQNSGNGGYYTDLIQVDQSVTSSNGGGTNNSQSIEGNVRQVDRTNGLFTVNTGNRGLLTVSMPYNPRRSDVDRFQSLRSGDYVRFYGSFLNNSRVELQQFY